MAYVRKKGEEQNAAQWITEAIGYAAHIKINFVPCMMSALAMDQALRLCDAARDLRYEPLKRPCREVRAAVKEYGMMMARTIDDTEGFNALLKKYDAYTATEQFLSDLQARLDAANTKGCKCPECAGHAMACLELMGYAFRLDADADKMLTEKLGRPVWRRKDPEWLAVREAVRKALEVTGALVAPSELTERWLKVIDVKSQRMVDEIIAEESLGEPLQKQA